MSKAKTYLLGWLFVLFVGFVMAGCVSTDARVGSEMGLGMTGKDSFTITEEDLQEGCVAYGDMSPERLICDGVIASRRNFHKQAGDLLIAGYQAGKEQGHIWDGRVKVNVLSEGLRSYFVAGSVEEQKRTAHYILTELSALEQKYLRNEIKVLIYWATMTEKTPAFEGEIPQQLRIADYTSLKKNKSGGAQ